MYPRRGIAPRTNPLALDKVSKAAPDGCVLNVVSGSTYSAATVVHNIPKNLLQALDPITQYTEQPFVLVSTTKGDVTFNPVPELVAYAKKNPGKMNYASSGLGGSAYLAAEYMKHEFGGIEIQHIVRAATDVRQGFSCKEMVSPTVTGPAAVANAQSSFQHSENECHHALGRKPQQG